MSGSGSLLDAQLRKHVQVNGGAVLPDRGTINIVAPGASGADNPTAQRTDITFGSSGGGMVGLWTVTTGVALHTDGTDCTLGAGAASILRTRDVGGDREVEYYLQWGTAPNHGTGNLLIPLSHDLVVQADLAQLVGFDGVGDVRAWSWGPNATPTTILSVQPGAISADGETRVEFAITFIPFRAPVAGDLWVFKFSCPRKS